MGRELLDQVVSLALVAALRVSSLLSGLQAVLRVHIWAVLLFGALLAHVGITFVAMQDARRPDTASGSRSAVFTENDTFFSENVLVMNRFEW